MKNKKGFTLVELLAVIVILGVLLLIAVPAVQNVISSSKEKSFKNATVAVLDGIKTQVQMKELEGTIFPIGTTTCYVDFADIDLERGKVDGVGYVIITKPASGSLTYTVNALSDSGFKFVNASEDNVKEGTLNTTGTYTKLADVLNGTNPPAMCNL